MAESALQAIDEYFSNSLRRILIYSNKIAKKVNATDIDTEHLLLGIIKNSEKDEVIQNIFKKLKISIEEITQATIKEIKSGKNTNSGEYLQFSARTKNALLSADKKRREWNHHMTAGEHLLFVLSSEEGIAKKILEKFGMKSAIVESTILSIIGKGKQKDILEGGGLTPMLDKFGDDLCQMAREGKIDAVIGRGEQIERSIHILARRRKNNPLLIGEPGVGKTAIVEGLANRMVKGDVPEVLKGKRLISLSLNSLVAGASKRGEFEQRMEAIIKEVKSSQGEIILFIDEIHTIVSGNMSGMSQILKPPLARGEIHCIGATTIEEHHEYIEQDNALARRFQQVLVPEPSLEEAIQILTGARDKYEAFHRVKISDEIVKLAVELSDRYINDRFLPDKAFDLIDEASAMARVPSISTPEKEKKLEKEIQKLEAEKDRIKGLVSIDEMTSITKKIRIKKKELEEIKKSQEEEKARSHDEVSKDHLLKIIQKWSGVPIGYLSGSESERLMELEKDMHQRIIGQNYPVKIVCSAVRRGRSGIRKPKRPIGSFLFLGPSGVGKTEFAKTLGEILFGHEDTMIRFDMSEFMEKHALARLTGPPPGYVGYEKGGELTEAVRKRPYSVVLLDEVEKAHPDIFLLLLQILDDGRLTDNHGRLVSFKHTILICTSNLAGGTIVKKFEERWNGNNSKFQSDDLSENEDKIEEKNNNIDLSDDDFQKLLKSSITQDLLKFFRPEVLNRFDDTVFFSPLREKELARIVEIMLREPREMLAERKITLKISDSVKKFLAKKGYNPIFGARPLRRAIQTFLEDPLSESLITLKFKNGDGIFVDLAGDELIFQKDVAEQKATDIFEDNKILQSSDAEDISKNIDEKDIFDDFEKDQKLNNDSNKNNNNETQEKGNINDDIQENENQEDMIDYNNSENRKFNENQLDENNQNLQNEEEDTEKNKEEKKSFFSNIINKVSGKNEVKQPEEGGIKFVDGKIVIDD